MRAYYGPEFCQSLLPKREKLRQVYRTYAARGDRFTLVTPPVNDAGMKQLDGLFDLLARQQDEIEVVANDWGVLALLAGKHRRLIPVFGRLLTRMLRDPRIAPRFNVPDAPDNALLALQQCSITSLSFRRQLWKLGVSRVELDNLFQGIAVDFAEVHLRPSIHIPYGYVTSGRICLYAGLHHRRDEKFSCQTPCRFECQTYAASISSPVSSGNGYVLWHVGNAVLYQQNEEMLEKALSFAAAEGARIVYRANPSTLEGCATEDIAVARQWLKERSENRQQRCGADSRPPP